MTRRKQYKKHVKKKNLRLKKKVVRIIKVSKKINNETCIAFYNYLLTSIKEEQKEIKLKHKQKGELLWIMRNLKI